MYVHKPEDEAMASKHVIWDIETILKMCEELFNILDKLV